MPFDRSIEGDDDECSMSSEPLRKKSRPQHVDDASMDLACREVGCGLIMWLDVDSMVLMLSFLEVNEAYRIVTSPLSRGYRKNFCENSYLWQQMCLGDLFGCTPGVQPKVMLGNIHTDNFCLARGQYMSFMKCKQYVEKLSEGKELNLLATEPALRDSASLSAPGAIEEKPGSAVIGFSGTLDGGQVSSSPGVTRGDNISELTRRLLGQGARSVALPAYGGSSGGGDGGGIERKRKGKNNILASNLITIKTDFNALPWTSPLHVLVNWLLFYGHVEGIVVLCLKVLPLILENKEVRETAASLRLADMIFEFMLKFPNSWRVNTAAMQNFVLLARPIVEVGGTTREGCLCQCSFMRESISVGDELVVKGNQDRNGDKGKKKRHGILIIFDALDRFWDCPDFMAPACWSLVNISLRNHHKVTMMQLGSIQRALATIRNHSNSRDVVFRAIYCLVNFVAPAAEDIVAPTTTTAEGQGVMERIVSENLEEILQTTIQCVFRWINDVEFVAKLILIFHNLACVRQFERALVLTPGCLGALRLVNNEYKNYGRIKTITEQMLHHLYETVRRDKQLEIDYMNMSNALNPS